uniref:ACB domain-containing protein n=1 Tax=Graphocephala atropunctata TaxID=36148 RepID=A0A1B6LS07_9HEMI
MSIQEKFEKAVNVIRNLPKNGSYHPSHELQLRFYAFYKQATEGCNCYPRPSFWEVVKRAKWDAWAKLGNMGQEEAMALYVEELRKIVETMSYTDNVASFLNSLDDFYDNVPAEDLEMLVGPIIDQIKSRPNSPLSGSPLASRDTSPTRAVTVSSHESSRLKVSSSAGVGNTAEGSHVIKGSLETSPTSSYSASPLPHDTDDEEENFLDTVMEPQGKDTLKPSTHVALPEKGLEPTRSQRPAYGKTCGTGKSIEMLSSDIKHALDNMKRLKNQMNIFEDTLHSEALPLTSSTSNSTHEDGPNQIFNHVVIELGKQMDIVQGRMNYLEDLVHRQLEEEGNRRWGLPLESSIFLMTWPLLLMLFAKWFSSRRNR